MKIPSLTNNDNPDLLSNYSSGTVEKGTPESNPLSVYGSGNSNPTVNMGNNMSADITKASEQPVNNDLSYYTQLANMKSKNDLLVEKYGLQGIRDEAVNELAQQDVLRQQSERALEEQLRASGMNNGSLGETMKGNLLMNYNKNVKDILSKYGTNVNSAVDQQRLDSYNEIKDNILSDLSIYNSKEVLDAINNADLSEQQRSDLLRQYKIRMSNANEDVVVPTGGKLTDDGGFTIGNIKVPQELTELFGTDEAVSILQDRLSQMDRLSSFFNNKTSFATYEQYRDGYVDSILNSFADMQESAKSYYRPYLQKLFDENVSDDIKKRISNSNELAKTKVQENETLSKVGNVTATTVNPNGSGGYKTSILGEEYKLKEVPQIYFGEGNKPKNVITKINDTIGYYGDDVFVLASKNWLKVEGLTKEELLKKLK